MDDQITKKAMDAMIDAVLANPDTSDADAASLEASRMVLSLSDCFHREFMGMVQDVVMIPEPNPKICREVAEYAHLVEVGMRQFISEMLDEHRKQKKNKERGGDAF